MALVHDILGETLVLLVERVGEEPCALTTQRQTSSAVSDRLIILDRMRNDSTEQDKHSPVKLKS
jgi:hypothetical protein